MYQVWHTCMFKSHKQRFAQKKLLLQMSGLDGIVLANDRAACATDVTGGNQCHTEKHT